MQDYRLLIGGRLVPGAMTMNVINPATEEVLAVAPRADRRQLEQAVGAAKAAFPRWSATPVRERAELLGKLVDAIEARQGEFAKLLTAEQGKPLAQAMGEMTAAITRMRYYSNMDLSLRVLKEDATRKVVQQHMPLGVVVAISA
jgi:acyl-CoA reductase-like NAD-dependent aldehyde dehydrogenase